MSLSISTRTSIPFMIVVLLAIGTSVANGQQSTEQFIPIGSSPGVSGRYSYIGQVVAVDLDSRRLTVENATGQHTIAMNPETRIWLDRSTVGRANAVGSYADFHVGGRVEVMPMRDNPGVAAWIKIEAQ